MEVLGRLMDCECKKRCVDIGCRRQRRMSELRIETGRWCGVSRDERISKKYGAGEMEDLEHLLLRCIFMVEERRQMEKLMEEIVDGWHEMEDNEKVVVVVVDEACEIAGIQRAVETL